MRTEADRAGKYEGKIIGASQKARIDAYGRQQAANFKSYVAGAQKIELDVKQMVGSKAPLSLLNCYIIFAKQVTKLAQKYTGETLIGEIQILDDLWASRGLDPDLLEGIKHYYVPSYPYLNVFRLDSSLLDGDDKLS